MRLYTSLSKLRYLNKSYSFKYLFIAFLGIHIPLIGIVVLVLLSGIHQYPASLVIECTLMFTLIACAITLLMQNALTKPIVATKNALTDYLSNQTLPKLPTHFEDEAGILMSNTSVALYELDGLLKDKRDFIYLLSHDLKTPLHNVLTLTHLMHEDEVNESKEEYLQLIKQSTRNQLDLISSVLNLASSDFTDLAVMKPVQLQTLVNKIVKDHSVSIENKQLSVLIAVPWHIQISVNEELFTMALVNLLTNAIKFSKRGGEIKVRAVAAKDAVTIKIIDDGIGFAVEKAPSFEAFSKISRPGTDGESSNGLGLYYTHKIVNYHKGNLAAHSEGDDKGAQFIIKLPVAVKALVGIPVQ